MDAATDTPGKILNDKKRAQGQGPPFRCEFAACTAEGENEARYCSQHRCQWSPRGALGPCERARAAAAFKRGLFAYCLTHKCRHLACRSARHGEMPYCARHTCQTPGCRRSYAQWPRVPGSPLYCEEHECLNFGCPRPRRLHTERPPAASAPGEAGRAERAFFGYFCSEHECREEGCYVGVVPPDATFGYGMGYCSYHLVRLLPPPPEAKKKKRHGCFRS